MVSKGTSLLAANPSIILIQVIPAIPSFLSDFYSSRSVLDPLPLFAAIASAVLSVIASGAYPPVVMEATRGQRLTIGEALGRAYGRFWSLVGAGILVVIIVVLGLIALVVPGIIFATWYAYTVPAIMLENKGAIEGMSASKAFGRDKKWSTFTLFLVFFVVYIIVEVIGAVLSLGGGGRVIQTLLTIPLSAWTSVVIAYAYVAHGPLSTTPTAAGGGWQQPSQAPSASAEVSAGTQPPQGASRFCVSCGSPLRADAKFCPNCGKPV